MTPRIPLAVTALAVTVVALAGCVAKDAATTADALTVTSDDNTCGVSAAGASSGTLAFNVNNSGTQVTEFYLLASDGLRIVGEIENIAPGATRTLTVIAQPGDYLTVCKPGMVGEGIGRAAFTVTGDQVAVTGADAQQKQQAVNLYAAFVKDQVEQLLPAAETFTAAYAAGDDVTARAQFPQVRAFYERIEPVASTLGDLDPKIDYREVDAVAENLEWTGFHRIEKDLWVPAADALNADQVTPAWQNWSPSTPEQRAQLGERLLADIGQLYDYVHSDDFQAALDGQGIAAISNGAISLLDEVATKKITGEEDWWSHTDLYDFAANIEGAKMSFSFVKDFASATGAQGATLVERIQTGFASLENELATHGSLSAGFVPYTDLTAADKRALVDQINTLAEPLSRLTGTILN
ncbi:MAG: peptidase M75 family protein [Microbacterium sp.]|uniref:iron uptake system protein EfeO n=1 Tax=Microbacterium sp. TaxID=51671 RepID=UPI001AC4382F|nr:iron uptake system protein EfeO [Microbacterium sp.]MBN9178913.1 peptidase M75 family protein [Microbacterium sp.]